MDFTTCPLCGEDAQFYSEEILQGSADINVSVKDDGSLDTAEFSGYTDVDWSNSKTTGFYCYHCGEELPADYSDALADALGAEWSVTKHPA